MDQKALVEPNESIYMLYGHLEAPSHLTVRQIVEAGDTIGVVGSSGNSSGIHLHLELRAGFSDQMGYGQIAGPANFGTMWQSWWSMKPINPHLLFEIVKK